MQLPNMPWLRVRHVVTQLARLKRGKYSDFRIQVKAKMPFNFKVTFQEDETETLEEDKSYKQKYTHTLESNVSM